MPATQYPIAYHLIPAAAWEVAPAQEPLRPGSLASEGFVHMTHGMADLVEVANTFYRDEPGPHVVLTIALRWLDAPWRYDTAPSPAGRSRRSAPSVATRRAPSSRSTHRPRR